MSNSARHGHHLAVTPPRLLEREQELCEIRSAIKVAARGSGKFVLVGGTAGVGKTWLLQEACSIAGSGFSPLEGCGALLEGEFPAGVLRQFFDGSTNAVTAPQWERMFAFAATPLRGVVDPLA